MRCLCCKKEGADVKRRRQRTAYADDDRNWATLCDECQEEADKMWQERWDEYYSMVM